MINLVVCGAHMRGLALNHQLTSRNAKFIELTHTTPVYQLYAMPAMGQIPPRPALFHVGEGGVAIQVEVWEIGAEQFGDFVAQIPAPLGIGKVSLEGDREFPGFIAEPRAKIGAQDISHLGGWRKFLDLD
eukprot:TRINITY_DN17422_c0_g1_i4.p2 TRINITY_DN17422_c0_g1~~TRINITY_DN17422_c0_g1_i4.p2  ORF type:complete len:130 (-),score=24.19 TRINITY_DN17422_c0_g1_i4:225-614(-)